MSQSEGWQLGGNVPEVYETELVPALFGPWALLLVVKAARRSGSSRWRGRPPADGDPRAHSPSTSRAAVITVSGSCS